MVQHHRQPVNPVLSMRAVQLVRYDGDTQLALTLEPAERGAAGLVALVHDAADGTGRIVAAGRLLPSSPQPSAATSP